MRASPVALRAQDVGEGHTAGHGCSELLVEAIATLKELLSRNPNPTSAYVVLALSYLGQWHAQQDQTSPLLEQAMTAMLAQHAKQSTVQPEDEQ